MRLKLFYYKFVFALKKLFNLVVFTSHVSFAKANQYQRETRGTYVVPFSQYQALQRKLRLVTATTMAVVVVSVLSITIYFPAHYQKSSAATYDYTVNSLDDTSDGVCDDTNCTLREAIDAANNAGSNKTIGFSVTGTITLTSCLTRIGMAASGLSINGPGASQLTIDGSACQYWAIGILANNITISNLTVSGGVIGINSDNGESMAGENIHGVTIQNTSSTCISFGGGDLAGGSSQTNHTITNNTLTNCGNGGIDLWANAGNITISSNTISTTGNSDCISVAGQGSLGGNKIQNNNLAGCHNNGISIQGDGTNSNDNNTISGNTISGSGSQGILISYGSNNLIQNNTSSSNTYNGLDVSNSSSDTIKNNTTNSNGQNGISLYNASNSNTLSSNTASSNTNIGIKLDNASSNSITGNTASENGPSGLNGGIWISGGSANNTVSNNTFNGNGIGAIITGANSSNNLLTGNTINNSAFVHGIAISANANNNTVSNNTIDTTKTTIGSGIIVYTDGNLISSNSVLNCGANGIYLIEDHGASGSSSSLVQNNTIENNTIASAGSYGIAIGAGGSQGSDLPGANNSFIGNTVSLSGSDGIYISDANYATISSNTVFNNNQNGISLTSSNNNTLSSNTIYNHSLSSSSNWSASLSPLKYNSTAYNADGFQSCGGNSAIGYSADFQNWGIICNGNNTVLSSIESASSGKWDAFLATIGGLHVTLFYRGTVATRAQFESDLQSGPGGTVEAEVHNILTKSGDTWTYNGIADGVNGVTVETADGGTVSLAGAEPSLVPAPPSHVYFASDSPLKYGNDTYNFDIGGSCDGNPAVFYTMDFQNITPICNPNGAALSTSVESAGAGSGGFSALLVIQNGAHATIFFSNGLAGQLPNLSAVNNMFQGMGVTAEAYIHNILTKAGDTWTYNGIVNGANGVSVETVGSDPVSLVGAEPSLTSVGIASPYPYAALAFSDSSSNTLSSNIIHDNGNGISFTGASGSNTLTTDSITNSFGYDLESSSDGTNTLNNVLFNPAKANIFSGTFQIFFDVRAYANQGGDTPLANAAISLKSYNGSVAQLGATGSDGYTSPYVSMHPFDLTSHGYTSLKNPYTATTVKDNYLTAIEKFYLNTQNQTLPITLIPGTGKPQIIPPPPAPPSPPAPTKPEEAPSPAPQIESPITLPSNTNPENPAINLPTDQNTNINANTNSNTNTPVTPEPATGPQQSTDQSPITSPNPSPSPILVKFLDSPIVYLVNNSTSELYPILNEDVFYQRNYDFKDVITVPKEDYSKFTITGEIFYPDGTLVKSAGDPKVYILQLGKLHHIKDEATFIKYNYQWGMIKIVEQSWLDKLTIGDEIQ